VTASTRTRTEAVETPAAAGVVEAAGNSIEQNEVAFRAARASAAANSLFARYRIKARIKHKIYGGIPRDPNIVQGWLASKGGVTDKEEMARMVVRTLRERGVELDDMDNMPYEAVMEAAKQLKDRSTNGFKLDSQGRIVIETRQVKAGTKEGTNVLYAGEKWGPTRKGPRNYVAERLFVLGEGEFDDFVHLYHDEAMTQPFTEPSGVDLVIGHVSGPTGSRSTLTMYEFCARPYFAFDMLVAQDAIEGDKLAGLLEWFEMGGVGALRSQGFGTFEILDAERLPQAKRRLTIRGL
jgi:hypothetical protein